MTGNTSVAAAVCGTVAAVSGTICSSHLTSFLSVCVHSLALTLSPSLHVTQSPDYGMLSLSHPFHPTLSVKACGKAGLSRLHYVALRHGSSASDAAHSHKRVQTRTCGSALQHTEPTQGSDKMWLISHPKATVWQTKGPHMHAYTHIRIYTFTHAYANLHAYTHVR